MINIKDGSAITGTANLRLLAYAQQGEKYTSNVWGTYKHLREQGYQVKKGEKGTALFVPRFKKNEKEEVPEELTSFICVHFFNIDQTLPIDDILLQQAEEQEHQQ